MVTAAPASDIDLYTEESIRSPYRDYRALRDLGPAVWLAQYQVWVVARYREVYAALHDHETFSSGSGVALSDAINERMRGTTLASDPPYHDHVRGLINGPLTPKALRKHQALFQEVADDLVDKLLGQSTFDAVTDFAQVLPLSVVPDLLGWPAEGRERFLPWASAAFNTVGPMNERAAAEVPAMREMWQYIAEMAESGRLRDGSWGADLVTAAAAGKVEKQLIPSLIGDYLVPSLDTTISALTSALWLFGRHPEQWHAVRADNSLIPNALNEIIRYESPARGFSRLLTRDHAFDGVELPAGSRVLMLYASANRDERKWATPDVFDIRRPNAKDHVGFGHGIHGCVGQGLARLEGNSLLTALAKRVRHIEVGEPTWRVNNHIRAIASMPATLTA
ncbi:MAG TPA: cytochrome P450 [Pseudonocardiaceae bacterium]|jgi:cytochrome P450